MAQHKDASLSHYIGEAQRHETLDRETEQQLAELWQKRNDPKAADRLIRSHLRYVIAVANKYRRYGVPMSELIAEGNFGLMHALRKFEPERGYRFVTYAAYWIRAYILNYVIRSWSMVGGGSGALRSKVFFKLRRERVRLMNQLGDSDQVDELLAQHLKVSPEQVQAMLRRLEARDVSLDLKPYSDGPSTIGDSLPALDVGQEESIGRRELQKQLKAKVRSALAELDERERFIVEKRLLADPEDELSLAEIGRKLGVSRERARQLEARAKGKLKHELHDFSEEAETDSPERVRPGLERRQSSMQEEQRRCA